MVVAEHCAFPQRWSAPKQNIHLSLISKCKTYLWAASPIALGPHMDLLWNVRQYHNNIWGKWAVEMEERKGKRVFCQSTELQVDAPSSSLRDLAVPFLGRHITSVIPQLRLWNKCFLSDSHWPPELVSFGSKVTAEGFRLKRQTNSALNSNIYETNFLSPGLHCSMWTPESSVLLDPMLLSGGLGFRSHSGFNGDEVVSSVAKIRMS